MAAHAKEGNQMKPFTITLFVLLSTLTSLSQVTSGSELLLAKTSVSQDDTCYTCFFAHEHSNSASLIPFYSLPKLDMLVNADSQLVLDHITGKPDCSVL